MTTMYVKSFIPCPLCGKEMRQMAGSWYYDCEAGLVSIECDECNLEIKEYGFMHGLKDGEAQSYHKLINILKGRIKK